MCVSGAGRGRMALIWLAAVILELSSRSRPPAERGRAPVEQGREGGRLAGPLRAGDLGLWGEMGLKVWYYSTVEERACWQSRRFGLALSHFHLSAYLSLSLYESLFFSFWQTHTLGRDDNWVTIMLRKTLEGVFTHTWVLLKLWALLHARDWFFSCHIKNLSEMTYRSFICFATFFIFYLQIL